MTGDATLQRHVSERTSYATETIELGGETQNAGTPADSLPACLISLPDPNRAFWALRRAA